MSKEKEKLQGALSSSTSTSGIPEIQSGCSGIIISVRNLSDLSLKGDDMEVICLYKRLTSPLDHVLSRSSSIMILVPVVLLLKTSGLREMTFTFASERNSFSIILTKLKLYISFSKKPKFLNYNEIS